MDGTASFYRPRSPPTPGFRPTVARSIPGSIGPWSWSRLPLVNSKTESAAFNSLPACRPGGVTEHVPSHRGHLSPLSNSARASWATPVKEIHACLKLASLNHLYKLDRLIPPLGRRPCRSFHLPSVGGLQLLRGAAPCGLLHSVHGVPSIHRGNLAIAKLEFLGGVLVSLCQGFGQLDINRTSRIGRPGPADLLISKSRDDSGHSCQAVIMILPGGNQLADRDAPEVATLQPAGLGRGWSIAGMHASVRRPQVWKSRPAVLRPLRGLGQNAPVVLLGGGPSASGGPDQRQDSSADSFSGSDGQASSAPPGRGVAFRSGSPLRGAHAVPGGRG